MIFEEKENRQHQLSQLVYNALCHAIPFLDSIMPNSISNNNLRHRTPPIKNIKLLTSNPTKNLLSSPPLISLRANLPKLSSTPIVRDLNITVLVHESIFETLGVGDDGYFVGAVEVLTDVCDDAGEVEVAGAEEVDGGIDGGVFLLALCLVLRPFTVGFRQRWFGEEEDAETEEKEDWSG